MSAEPLPMRPFSASLPMALLLARESTMRRFRPLLAEHGLTEQQWRVLRALASADEPIEVSVLADRTALLAPSVTRIVARLADDGVIRRDTVAGDARRSALQYIAHVQSSMARSLYCTNGTRTGPSLFVDLLLLLRHFNSVEK